VKVRRQEVEHDRRPNYYTTTRGCVSNGNSIFSNFCHGNYAVTWYDNLVVLGLVGICDLERVLV